MFDRQKIEAILSRRFPGVTSHQIAAAANAIMGLDEEWEEVVAEPQERPLGYHICDSCGQACFLAREVGHGAEFRLLRRRAGLVRER